ncbi:MAG: hypothetical protein H6Q16_1010 [Bacteroidetes bacterium]|nr:hypothetical protein [Bacteroidota bacterium]
MNRKVFFIVSLFVFIIFNLTTIAQSKKKSDAEIDELRGKVMCVEYKAFTKGETFFRLIPIKRVISDEYTIYNKDGSIFSHKQINGYKENYSISLYKYDERGNCIERIDSNYDEGITRSRVYNHIYKYDNSGNIIEESNYFNNEFSSKYYYKYDENGNCYESISYESENDSAFSKTLYIRDKDKKKVEWIMYNKLGDLDSRFIREYDNNGNVIKVENFNQEDTLPSVTFYKYNDKNDITEQSFFDNKTNTKYIVYKIKYKYDSKGNWIKGTKYNKDGSIEFIHKRKIKYYKDSVPAKSK